MLKNKKILFSAFLLTTLLTVTACGQSVKAFTPGEIPGETPQEESFNLTIPHELGETKLTKRPEKVVVFDYGLLDLLDNLQVDVAGLPKATLPEFLKTYDGEAYADLGTLKEPDFEAVYNLAPDLILISTRTAAAYEELSKIAPTVYIAVDNADYMGSVEKNLTLLGEIFGKEAEAKTLASTFQEKISTMKEKVSALQENALIILANEGTLSAYGAVSRFGLIHHALGYQEADQGIEASTHGQSVTFEYILEKNPENLFVIDRSKVVGGQVDAVSTVENDILKQTDAFKNGKIFYLNPEVWYITAGGFTSTQLMLEDMEAALK
jgi:iron complex transport system substrate-binding protein